MWHFEAYTYIWQLKFPLPEALTNEFSTGLHIIKLEIITFYTNKTKRSDYSLCQP